MKKLIFIILAIIVGIVVYFAFFHRTVEAPKIDNIQKEELNVLTVTESKIQIVKEGYEVDFKFPVTGKQKIDSEIKKNVNQIVSTFEEEAQSFLLTPLPDQRAYTLISSYEARLGSEYDTFVFLISIDFGGAHPNHFYKTLTFDKTENIVSLSDVFNKKVGNQDVLSRVSELVRQKISEKLGENTNQQMLVEGTKPELENFKNFYIEGENIIFLFEPYAVAPYAYSTQEAKISFEEIRI